MEIVKDGIGYDLHHCYGACDGEIATYDPSYEEGSETTCHAPGQGFDHTTATGVAQVKPICRRISVPDMLVIDSSNFSSSIV